MFNIITDEQSNSKSIFCTTHNHYIPLDPANRHYQEMLDAIIEQGAGCFEGDIPAELQTAADAKQFAQQAEAYKTASARLEQYQLSVGVPESTGTVVTGQEWSEETMEMQDVTETFVIPGIEPLDATVEVTTYDFDTNTSTTETIENPLITKDNAERAAAQAIIDSTPQAVKDSF